MTAMDVSGVSSDVYAARTGDKIAERLATVFVFKGADGKTKCELDGSDTPVGEFDFGAIGGAISLDQSNGDLYVYDIGHGVVDRFTDSPGGCPQFAEADPDLGELPEAPKFFEDNVDIAVDSPCWTGSGPSEPCNVGKYESPNPGHVFIAVGTTKTNSHLYAYAPRLEGPPEIRGQAAVEIGEAEAVLRAELNSHGLSTTYRFEYTTQRDFEDNGYASSKSVPVIDADGGAGGNFAAVSEPISGLEPGVAYRFRLVAANAECTTIGEGVAKTPHEPCREGPDASFTAYAVPPTSLLPCPNAALRIDSSAVLPDCRAYELVTPPDTNGRIPTMAMLGEGFGGIGFDTRLASPSGDSLVFGTLSGSLPGIGGGGNQDTYEALRDPVAGWDTSFTGISGAQARRPHPGGISADHRYAFWNVEGEQGTLVNPVPPPSGGEANYLRVPVGTKHSSNCLPEGQPEGRFEWIGCGSLGFEPRARGKWIGPGGRIIFATDNNNSAPAQRLETCAPPSKTNAIYERIPGGPTRCVSLLPGDVTPGVGAVYRSTSADGSVIAFSVGSALYVRVDGTETLEVATGSPIFGGISVDGTRIIYLQGGDVFACDLDEGGCVGEGGHEPIAIGVGGDSTLVNVSEDGSHVYFLSKAVLSGEEENGHGAKAKAGEENLYAWDGSAARFLAIVDPIDISGEAGFGGLGLWASDAFNPGTTTGPANDPSRTNPSGTVLVFESRADLTGYPSDGHREIYRYDSQAGPPNQLVCISCNPTGTAAASDARLESKAPPSVAQPFPPVNSLSHIDNVSSDGRMVFFQSADRLISADGDKKLDVYEWEARDTGGCAREEGCLSLISSGDSEGEEYLYAMTPDGRDVFFLSSDALVDRDPDGTPSIYDARVEGGYAEEGAQPGECLGEACQPLVAAPEDPHQTSRGSGNPKPAKPCPKPRAKRAPRRTKRRCTRHPKHKGGKPHRKVRAHSGAQEQ